MQSDSTPSGPSTAPPTQRQLRAFTTAGYDKGRARPIQALWFATMNLVFVKWWCPAWLRVALLRAFGADIGERVLIRHRVRVLWPWKLRIADDVWIGEGAWLLNLENIDIGHDVCVSQEVFMCTGSHQWRSPTFEYDNAPIVVEPSAWIGARATLLRGITIGERATVSAGVVVKKSVPAGCIAH
jgi:putative colanic acid biosynthesis acetyltransferase WcaF